MDVEVKRRTWLVLLGALAGGATGTVFGFLIGGIGIAVSGGAFGIVAPVVIIVLGVLGIVLGGMFGYLVEFILRKTIDRPAG
ncbi:MAG: hypothetical protein F4Y03_12325 [Alphaproteobacteria bacterium]|nr:hypothetical protein [Alphaproteobacteria bacterium]